MKHKTKLIFVFTAFCVPVFSSPVQNETPVGQLENKSPKVEAVVEIVKRKSPKQDEGDAGTGEVSGLLGLFASSLEEVIPGDTGETVSGYLQQATSPIQAFFEQPVKQIADYFVASVFTTPAPLKVTKATTPKPTEATTPATSVIYVINQPAAKPANTQGASYTQAASSAAIANGGNFNQAPSNSFQNNYNQNTQGNFNQAGNFNQGGFQNSAGNYQQSNINNNPIVNNQQSLQQNSGGFGNNGGNYNQAGGLANSGAVSNNNYNNPNGNPSAAAGNFNQGGFSNFGAVSNNNFNNPPGNSGAAAGHYNQGGFNNPGSSSINNFNNDFGNTAAGNYNQGGFKKPAVTTNNNFNGNSGNNYNNGVQNAGSSYNQGGFPNTQSQGNYNQQGVIGNYNNNNGALSNSATNNNFGINEPSNSGQAIYKNEQQQQWQNQNQANGVYKVKPGSRNPVANNVNNVASSNVISPSNVPVDYDVEEPVTGRQPGVYQLEGDPNNRRRPILPNQPASQTNPRDEDDEADANKPIAALNQKITNRFNPANQPQLGQNIIPQEQDPSFFNNGPVNTDSHHFVQPQYQQPIENFNQNQNFNNQIQQNSNQGGNLNYFNPGQGQRQKVQSNQRVQQQQQQQGGANLGIVGRPNAQVQIFQVPGPVDGNAAGVTEVAVTEGAPVASSTDDDDDDGEDNSEDGEVAVVASTT